MENLYLMTPSPLTCCACGSLVAVPFTIDGCTFCSAACQSEYQDYIAAELARAREAFLNRTPVHRARIADYNAWAARVSTML